MQNVTLLCVLVQGDAVMAAGSVSSSHLCICSCVWNRPRSPWPCGCGISTSWKGSGCWRLWLTPSSNCTKVRSHLTLWLWWHHAGPPLCCWPGKPCWPLTACLVPCAGCKRHSSGEEMRCHKGWLAVLSTQKPHPKYSQPPLPVCCAAQVAFRGNTDSSPSVCSALCGGSTEKFVEGQVNLLMHF